MTSKTVMLMFLLFSPIVSVLGYSRNSERNFRCYKDLCTYDEQFCNWQEQRCQNCEDFSDYCGKREQPNNCSVFCGKFLIQQTLVSCRANCSGNEPDNGNEEHEPVQEQNINQNKPWKGVIPTSEDTDYNLVAG